MSSFCAFILAAVVWLSSWDCCWDLGCGPVSEGGVMAAPGSPFKPGDASDVSVGIPLGSRKADS